MSDPVATTYLVNKGAFPHEWITVDLTCFAGEGPHKPPADTWAVRTMGRCLNADGEWEYEPQPSSRDDAFYARTRWSLDEALRRAQEAVAKAGKTPDSKCATCDYKPIGRKPRGWRCAVCLRSTNGQGADASATT